MKQCYMIMGFLFCLGMSARAQQAIAWKPLKASLAPVNNKNTWFPSKRTAISPPAPTAYLNTSIPLPDSYYQQGFGFFCKREWELQQKVHVPVKVRLGSYQAAQAQEGYAP